MDYEAAAEMRDAIAGLRTELKDVRDAILTLAMVMYGATAAVPKGTRDLIRDEVYELYNRVVKSE